jgi:cathepsin L
LSVRAHFDEKTKGKKEKLFFFSFFFFSPLFTLHLLLSPLISSGGLFQVPYFNTKVPITAWTDEDNSIQKVEYYGGQDTFLYRYDLGNVFEIVPRIDQYICMTSNVTGPSRKRQGGGSLVLPLVPDISKWSYQGAASVHGIDVDQFQTTVVNVTQWGTGTNVYNMFINSATRQPVQLHMSGINFIMGSHPDIYIFDYYMFEQRSNFSAAEFDVPPLCSAALAAPASERLQRRSHHRARAALAKLARVMPPITATGNCPHSVHPRFHDFALTHGKHYIDCVEHETRQKKFLANLAFIEAWNADPTHTHTVAVNQFADMDDDEYRAVILLERDGETRSALLRAATASSPVGKRARGAAVSPASIDWRQKGVVNRVADQDACGSCFVFGSMVALEGQWAINHGKLLKLSQQQGVDCSWGFFGNQACDGGFAPGVFSWAQQAGGVALEQTYPYLEQDGWCNANDQSSGVVVKGYFNITDMASLIQAVGHVGPIAIAIDASLSSFRFYQAGIYNDPACQTGVDDLDHEVAAVGYGTDLTTGQNYVLVQNSWFDSLSLSLSLSSSLIFAD